MSRRAVFALCLCACASSPDPLRMEDWMRVGVTPLEEAERVRENLEAAGWQTVQRLEAEGQIALAFRRDEQRAVRVVTSRGVVVGLDSHDSNGILVRHGSVSLVEREDPDVDGDGRPDIVVAREEEGHRCIAVIRIDETGGADLMEDDAEALHDGACVARLEDVDGDDRVEAIVELSWPDLGIGQEVARFDVALVESEAAWRAEGMPVAYVEREREARRQELEAARTRRDIGAAVRLAVELAVIAHLTGASIRAQVRYYDEALAGLVLSVAERDRIVSIRRVIAAGWRAEGP